MENVINKELEFLHAAAAVDKDLKASKSLVIWPKQTYQEPVVRSTTN